MVIVSKHLLAWRLSAGPSHSQHERKLSLMVSGQGGRASRAGETLASFIRHSRPLCWRELPAQNLQKKKQRVGCESALQSGLRWVGIRTGFALVLANKHINSKVDNHVVEEGAEGQPLVFRRAVQREL